VQNSGWELTLNTINVHERNFNWTSNLNLTILRNKLISFPDLETSGYAHLYVVGQPITLVKAFHFLGVDPATGRYLFASVEGNATPTPIRNRDNTVMINTSPDFYGGLSNNFRYKKIEMDIFFQFTKQVGENYFFGSSPGSINTNQPNWVLNRWQQPGDIATYQRYNSNSSLFTQINNAQNSDAYYTDASFIRLKNMSLSWQLPDGLLEKSGLERARIYIQGQNLFTLTNYMGLDPETKSTRLPPLRIITVGMQITL
jgi:hypothetical protein